MVTLYLTKKNIPYDAYLVQKIDLMIKRVMQKNPKLDSVLQIEGGEGTGKTTFSSGIAYLVAFKTGKSFSDKNVFTDTQEALTFAQNTEGQIIIFDEPGLNVLSAQWWNRVQQDLIKLLMLSRKKRHFIIFNFTKFYKFPEYIVVDRCLCMLHVYEMKNSPGNYAFVYIPHDALEFLYNDYRYKKIRSYFKYGMFTGKFADVLNPDCVYNILDEFDLNAYNYKKDLTIKSIGDKKVDEIVKFKARVGRLKCPIMNKEELAKQLHVSRMTLNNWERGVFDEENTALEATDSATVKV